MARRSLTTRLPPPFLKRVWLDPARVARPEAYPFCLPVFRGGDFEILFERPITIVVGENGAGKSTLLEGIAALCGFDVAGGSRDHRPLDHAEALAADGDALAPALRAAWLPKVAGGWFFRAESVFSVARSLDAVNGAQAPDYLSRSHGEGVLRVFRERCLRQGVFLFDEPEAALSPRRQVTFLALLREMERMRAAQVIIATHSPILMAYPGAALMAVTRAGLAPVRLGDTAHFRLYREFCDDPELFVEAALAAEEPSES
ncbi:AAA family ATPase [Methylobacterium sp. WSM2598]|uniref:AAA family ATPase n=1 Tax=Methylobacterium sp. WSM2598 TaxID=398261 RepID=UPI000373F1A6|nr:AAA family ATPase [Methylobacterium sp. WSM2598]